MRVDGLDHALQTLEPYLGDLILCGAWAWFFYRRCFGSDRWIPAEFTRDLDCIRPERLPVRGGSLCDRLEAESFEWVPRGSDTPPAAHFAWPSRNRPEIEIEFLVPARGREGGARGRRSLAARCGSVDGVAGAAGTGPRLSRAGLGTVPRGAASDPGVCPARDSALAGRSECGATPVTPADPGLSAGVAVVPFDGADHSRVYERLYTEHRSPLRPLAGCGCARTCTIRWRAWSESSGRGSVCARRMWVFLTRRSWGSYLHR